MLGFVDTLPATGLASIKLTELPNHGKEIDPLSLSLSLYLSNMNMQPITRASKIAYTSHSKPASTKKCLKDAVLELHQYAAARLSTPISQACSLALQAQQALVVTQHSL